MKFPTENIVAGHHFTNYKGSVHYYRHTVKDYDVGHNLSIDFVKKPTKRGYRVNIRPCKKPFKGYDARGAYRFPQYLTKSTCWIRPDGVAEDIKENKNNNQQQAADEMLDWRPFMEALYNQLGLSE